MELPYLVSNDKLDWFEPGFIPTELKYIDGNEEFDVKLYEYASKLSEKLYHEDRTFNISIQTLAIDEHTFMDRINEVENDELFIKWA